MSDTRRRILDASINLVAEQGVRAVSFREVARRAGVSHQAPYHYFGRHQAILRAIAAEGFATLADAMDAASRDEADGIVALVAAGVAYVRFALDRPGHFRVMFDRSLVELEVTEPPLEDAVRTRAVLEGLAGRAHAQGHGRGLSAATLSDLCWSVVHGLATLMAEDLLGPADPLRTDADPLPARVIEALGGVLRG